MTRQQAESVSRLILEAPNGILGSRAKRAIFASQLSSILSYWSKEEMKSFVDEMAGLNFVNKSDRYIFLEFFDHWFMEAR
jgi:hypothetical protein